MRVLQPLLSILLRIGCNAAVVVYNICARAAQTHWYACSVFCICGCLLVSLHFRLCAFRDAVPLLSESPVTLGLFAWALTVACAGIVRCSKRRTGCYCVALRFGATMSGFCAASFTGAKRLRGGLLRLCWLLSLCGQ